MTIITEYTSPRQGEGNHLLANLPSDTRSKGDAVSRTKEDLPVKFAPTVALKRDSVADSVIAHAKTVKDWPLLENAIEQKLEDQALFVQWWDQNVTPNRTPDRSNRSVTSTKDAERLTGIKKMQVSRWRRRLAEPERYRSYLYGVTWARAMAERNDDRTTTWTGDSEWYTPAKYIEAARAVMGRIDLDPASNALAQKTVNAARWYSKEADGLLQEWEGRVFLNPPYSYPTVAQFTEKLCRGVELGSITTAILLVNNCTDTGWWHRAARLACAICFTSGRISFYKASGNQTQPTNGQNFFYFGRDSQAFHQHFSTFGRIFWPCSEEVIL